MTAKTYKAMAQLKRIEKIVESVEKLISLFYSF